MDAQAVKNLLQSIDQTEPIDEEIEEAAQENYNKRASQDLSANKPIPISVQKQSYCTMSVDETKT